MNEVQSTDKLSDSSQPDSASLADVQSKPKKPRISVGRQTFVAIIILPLASLFLGLLNLWDVLNRVLSDPSETIDPVEDAYFNMILDTTMNSIMAAVCLFLLLTWLLKWNRANRFMTLLCLIWSTIQLGVCVALLVVSITQYKVGIQLLADASCIWCINIVIFSIWYWFIDGGGPVKRLEGRAIPADLVFPQQASEFPGYTNWQPQLIDYFFLAFNHNMAFSPTDTLILSRRTKLLMMVQTTFALLAFAVALARAIGIV